VAKKWQFCFLFKKMEFVPLRCGKMKMRQDAARIEAWVGRGYLYFFVDNEYLSGMNICRRGTPGPQTLIGGYPHSYTVQSNVSDT
jgi:hypothetical protein